MSPSTAAPSPVDGGPTLLLEELLHVIRGAIADQPRSRQTRIGPSEHDDTHFWARVEGGDASTCWLWRGSKDKDGYGVLQRNKRVVRAHRWSYGLLRGDIPAGLVTDHTCQTPACVNPWHIDLVTAAENTRRVNARKTQCPQGHPYDERNTYYSKKGERYCRTCSRARTEAWKAKRRGGPARPYGAAITACPKGHPYDKTNTQQRPSGRRRCRACARQYAADRRAQRCST